MDIRDLIAKVRYLAMTNPEHVYQQGTPVNESVGKCFYLATTPGAIEACIFGRALTDLGVSPVFLNRCEGFGITRVIADLLDEGIFAVDPSDVVTRADNVYWCSDVQGFQDTGKPWAECIEEADKLSADRARRRASREDT